MVVNFFVCVYVLVNIFEADVTFFEIVFLLFSPRFIYNWILALYLLPLIEFFKIY